MDVSLGGAWVVTPTVRANAALGWGRERPETERWRHERRWLRTGLTVALPRGFTVGGSGELRWADFEGNWFPHTIGGEPREDRTRSLRASVHNRAFAWKGFSPASISGARGSDDQRPALRLQAHRRRITFRPAVLTAH